MGVAIEIDYFHTFYYLLFFIKILKKKYSLERKKKVKIVNILKK